MEGVGRGRGVLGCLGLDCALSGWLSRWGRHPMHGKVVSSIPSQGAYGRQPINVSVSLSLFLPVCLPLFLSV